MGWAGIAARLAIAGLVLAGGRASAQSLQELGRLSISQLAALDVSSVTRTTQPLSDAPAAIYVITHEEIMRSGAMSLPDILRLAPNLQVYQTSASSWVITARGFNGSAADQNFSNKLLVLIDGRSVYTPLFSGVYWDMQEVLPEDIERIEVISGPGATLWGANAVNGVINIITRSSAATRGGFLELSIGNLGRSASLEYSGRIGSTLAWRAYVTSFVDNDTRTASGARANDNWTRPQGGFRLDWMPDAADSASLEGNLFQGSEAHDGGAEEDISGRNLTANFQHRRAAGGSLKLLAYVDDYGRTTEEGGGSFTIDNYDLEMQDEVPLSPRDTLVWGAGYRTSRYAIEGTPALQFAPSLGHLNLAEAYAQDSLALGAGFTLIGGLKLEDDPYSGVTALPSLRLSWKANDWTLLWAAVSRAIRSPTPFDTDVVEKVGPTVFLEGAPDFRPEKLTAWEVGARLEPASNLSISISTFYNRYDDLRSIEPAPVTFLPLSWGNGVEGETYGLDAWAAWQARPWWRLGASLDLLHEHLLFAPGASGLVGIQQEADDPGHEARLTSSLALSRRISLDADLRWVGALPNPPVAAYAEADARLAWRLTPRLELSLAGFNLLHARHQELPPPANAVPRSVVVALRAHF
ncbi:MAG: TonB-dependent receptor plug domain-containing protein [Caulobacteraceae bacterium]